MNVAPHMIRRLVADHIDRLIALLDSLDGDPDMEPSLSGYSEGMDDREGDDGDGPEEDPAESGIADLDGYLEQCPRYFAHTDMRVE